MKFIALNILCLITFVVDISSAKAIVKTLHPLEDDDRDVYTFIKNMMEKHGSMESKLAADREFISAIQNRIPMKAMARLIFNDRYHELLRRKDDTYDDLSHYLNGFRHPLNDGYYRSANKMSLREYFNRFNLHYYEIQLSTLSLMCCLCKLCILNLIMTAAIVIYLRNILPHFMNLT